jgi:NADPH:quinone reductase-like Zn-dependent oxidoreductase
MKVMHYQGYGSPDRLVEAEAPQPSPDAAQVRIRVNASSVNPIDWKLHDGQLRWIVPRRFPAVPGLDVVGSVDKTGGAAMPFAEGDRVMSLLNPARPGASAGYCLADVPGSLVKVPAAMSDLEAAGLPLAGLTAWQGLIRLGRLQAGQRVLIVGASGGVGHFAVQIARVTGAFCVGVCSQANLDWVKQLGADAVVDYTTGQAPGDPHSFDLIFDCVSRLGHGDIQTLLKPGGIYVDTLFKPALMLRSLIQPLYTRQRYKAFLVNGSVDDLNQLLRLYAAGTLKTHIDSVYDLADLAEAHRRSQSGRARGKIVIRVDAA